MGKPIVQWDFINLYTDQNKATNIIKPPDVNKILNQQKTYDEVVNNICDIPLSELPKPYLKGGRIAIVILENGV